MRKFFSFLGLALCVAATLLALQHRAPKHSKNAGLEKATSASAAHASMQYGKLPLSFEPNLGQSSPEAKYLAHGDGYSLFLTSNEAVLVLGSSSKSKTSSAARADVLRMQLVGANSSATFSAIDQLPGKANYFRGRNPSAWHTNVPTYRKVAEEGIYPGVDLVYYGTQRQLEYDFIVAPGADIAPIRLSIQGGQELHIDNQGELVVNTSGGDVVLHKPVVYQEAGKEKQLVAANYAIDANNEVRFEIGTLRSYAVTGNRPDSGLFDLPWWQQHRWRVRYCGGTRRHSVHSGRNLLNRLPYYPSASAQSWRSGRFLPRRLRDEVQCRRVNNSLLDISRRQTRGRRLRHRS